MRGRIQLTDRNIIHSGPEIVVEKTASSRNLSDSYGERLEDYGAANPMLETNAKVESIARIKTFRKFFSSSTSDAYETDRTVFNVVPTQQIAKSDVAATSGLWSYFW